MSVYVDPAHLTYRGWEEVHEILLKAVEPKADMTVSQWADKRRVLSAKHAKQSGDWDTGKVPFMREIMDGLSARSPVRSIFLMKGAQVAGTECGNNWVGYTIDLDPVPMMFVCPTGTVAKRTSARIQAMIDDDPKADGLRSKVLPSRQRDAKNSQFEKHFPKGALYFASAQSATNLRSTMVERMILDEMDAYPVDVDGEGSVETVAEARGTTAGDDFKVLGISTPLIEQTSLIKRAFLRGDQRRFMVPCPHCTNLLYFRWEQFVWNEGDPKSVRYRCEHCSDVEPHRGLIHHDRHKRKMVKAGVWVPKVLQTPEALARIRDGDRAELDNFNVTALRRSYHLPSFYAMIGLTWAMIIERWERAAGDPHEVKSITNTVFGETYVPPGEAPSWEYVYGRRSMAHRLREVPRDVVMLQAGVDVGVDHVEFHVWGYGRKRRRFLVDIVRVDAPYNEPETWQAVEDLFSRVYLHPSGAVLPVRKILVDRAKWPDVVDPFVASQDRLRVIGQRGSKTFDAPIVRWSRRKDKGSDGQWGGDREFEYVTTGVSTLKLEFYGNLNLKLQPGKDLPPGWVSLPRDVRQETVKQLVSERLEFVSHKGKRSTPRWVDVSNTRHEALDCANYARAAAELDGWSRWTDHEFDREERAMEDQVKEIQAAVARLQHERAQAGDPRPVTLHCLFPTLVLPDPEEVNEHAMPATVAAPAEPIVIMTAPDPIPEPEADPVPEGINFDAAAPVTRRIVRNVTVQSDSWAGVRKDWGPGRAAPSAWGGGRLAVPGAGIGGCKDALKALLAPTTASGTDDD